MSVSFSGRRKRRKLKADINVVPYIDVMLVLLIIFMVTAPLLNLGVDIELPQSNAKPIEQQKDPVIVEVTGDGRYFLTLEGALQLAVQRVGLVRFEGSDEITIIAHRGQDPTFVRAGLRLPLDGESVTARVLHTGRSPVVQAQALAAGRGGSTGTRTESQGPSYSLIGACSTRGPHSRQGRKVSMRSTLS